MLVAALAVGALTSHSSWCGSPWLGVLMSMLDFERRDTKLIHSKLA